MRIRAVKKDLSGQINRLYIVRGVPLNTLFETQTRNEIRGIKWFEINNLPTHKKVFFLLFRIFWATEDFRLHENYSIMSFLLKHKIKPINNCFSMFWFWRKFGVHF